MDRVDGGDARAGLVDRDGRLAVLGLAILLELGFRADDDLTGLALASLWPAAERGPVAAALARAGDGSAARLALDLAYVSGRADARELLVEPAGDGRLALRLPG